MKKQIFLLIVLSVSYCLYGFSGFDDFLSVEKWLYLGPVNVGAREGLSGIPFYPEKMPLMNDSVFYRFYGARDLRWQELLSEKGEIRLEGDSMEFNKISEFYGFSGTLSQYFLFGKIDIEENGVYLVYAGGLPSFYVNGKKYCGDIYNLNRFFTPVLFKKGENIIAFQTGGYFGYADIVFKISKTCKNGLYANREYDMSYDLVKSEKRSGYISLEIINASLEEKNINITVFNDKYFDTTYLEYVKICPMQVKNIPVQISAKKAVDELEKEIILKVKIVDKNDSLCEEFPLSIKNFNESRKETYLSSVDNSVQYFAVKPQMTKNLKNISMIFTLHGAGVEAEGQVDAYRDYDSILVVAPTNRDKFGFDWQGFGRIDCMEVLKTAEERFDIDTNRIFLTGHSMGGHGAWVIGTLYPDRFAGLIPASGWPNYNIYIPQTFQRGGYLSSAEQSFFKNFKTTEDNPLFFLENLKNLSVMIVHGSEDDNVPVYMSRIFYNVLKGFSYNVVLLEYPNMGHWYDIKETDGIDCIDSDTIISFIRKLKKDSFPKSVVFKTPNLYINKKLYNLTIDREEKPLYPSIIEYDKTDSLIRVKTSNVEGFTIEGLEKTKETKKIIVNGKTLVFKEKNTLHVAIKNGSAMLTDNQLKQRDLITMERAFFSPFVFVYSTKNIYEESLSYYQAMFFANIWAQKGKGCVEICKDVEITKNIAKNFNLIMFGSPQNGTLMKNFTEKFDLEYDSNSVEIKGRKIFGKDLSFSYTEKIGDSDKYIVCFCGNSKKGMANSTFFNPITNNIAVNYIVFNEKVLLNGFSAVEAFGIY